MIVIIIWRIRKCVPNNHVYQINNIMQEMSNKSGIVIYIYIEFLFIYISKHSIHIYIPLIHKYICYLYISIIVILRKYCYMD